MPAVIDASTQNKTPSQALVEEYLKGSKNLTRLAAKNLADETMTKVDLNDFSLKDVKQSIAENKAAMKKYGFQEKLNYLSDSKAYDADPMDAMAQGVIAGAATVCMTTTMGIGGSAEGAVATMSLGTAAIIGKATAAWLSRAETKEQAKSVEEYTDLKHANLILKKVARAIERKEDKEMARSLMAQGLGNPGGFITPVSLAKKGKGR